MKYAIMGDIHFKTIKSNIESNYQERVFYFISKTLEERQIKDVIQLGDLFDDRKSIDTAVLVNVKRIFEKYFKNINMISLAGNHDVRFRNTNDICTTDILLDSVKTIIRPAEYDDLLLIPWINVENYDECTKVMENSKSKYCFGHFEINSFSMVKGFEETHGLSTTLFNKFAKVFSGHFHLTQDKGNICYVGSLFQNDRNDLNDIKRIFILDTDTDEIEEIRIPFELYKKYLINEESEMTQELINTFDEKIVDVTFNIPQTLQREQYINIIIDGAKTYEYQIIDNSELCKEKCELKANNDDVNELFSEYIKISDVYDIVRKTALNDLFVTVYKEVNDI